MKKFLPFLLLLIVSNTFSQDWPVKKLVTDRLSRGETFTTIPIFRFLANKQLTGRGTYQELQLDNNFRSQVMAQRPATLQLNIPVSSTETITCLLVKASLGNVVFTENNTKEIPNVKMPVTYRGIISGEQGKNNVILTVNDDYISLITTANNRTIQITQADSSNRQTYRLYNSQQVQFPSTALDCGTNDMAVGSSINGIPVNGTVNRTETVQDKCVYVFVDCFDSLYQHFSSNSQQTINYVYELYNLVATGYVNDSINIQVAGINVWTTMDPYRQDSSKPALADLGDYWQDNFWGNICVGLDYGNGRGGLAWIGQVKATTTNSCPQYNSTYHSGAFAYADLNFNGNIQNFPVGPNATQGQVLVTMHEMGHQLGSHHTHWCGWQLTPTIVGAIDSCTSVENGPCVNVGMTPPPGGGTIMSYCHLLAGSFVNYNNGFGPLPGNTIRNLVANTPCIPSCLACLDGMLYPGIDNKKQPDGRLPAGRAIDPDVETKHALSLLSSRYSPFVYPTLSQPATTR